MKQQPGSERGEDLDVVKVHGQIMREKPEPFELLRAAPGWLKHGIYAPLLIWALLYLFSASGGFKWNEYYEGSRSTTAMVSMIEPPADVPQTVASTGDDSVLLRKEGSQVYQQVCIACHQATGEGLAGVFPPLVGSEWVSGSDDRLAAIVLHGLMGPIEVKGQTWNGVMPPQGATLDDRQIAAVLTYIRSEWGNDSPPVEPATVGGIRETFSGHPPWTMETLGGSIP